MSNRNNTEESRKSRKHASIAGVDVNQKKKTVIQVSNKKEMQKSTQ